VKRDCQCRHARHEHGTPPGYWADDCRCFPCRTAYDRHVYRQRHGQDTASCATYIDATGTRRRLEALHALGWSGADLGARLGVGYSAVNQLRKQTVIFPRTAERVRAVYDELWATPSTGPHATRIKRWAARRGFLPPMAYDDDRIDDMQFNSERDLHNLISDRETHGTAEIIDEIAVERAIHGDRVPLTRAEMTYAIDTLTRMGHSAEEAATRLGVSSRLVQRYRAKGRAA
jgi:transcriptional regulator with XRE-family HTH domain